MLNVKKIGLLFLVLVTVTFATSALQNRANLVISGKKVGYATVLTPVEIVKTMRGKTVVKIKGFRSKNYPQLVVRDMTRREVYAEMKNEATAIKTFKVIKKYEDDYGEIWQEVEGTFTINSKEIAKNTDKLYLSAKKTYEKTCSMCHRLPESTAYTVNQWPQQLDSMKKQVKLSPKTRSLVLKYLQHNAKDAK